MYIERREKREGRSEREREMEERNKSYAFLTPKSGFTIISANSWRSEWMSETESLTFSFLCVWARDLPAIWVLIRLEGCWWKEVYLRCPLLPFPVPSPPLPKPTTTAFCEDWDTKALFIFCVECWVSAHCLNTSYSLCLECYSSWNLHKSYNPFSDRPFLCSMCLL